MPTPPRVLRQVRICRENGICVNCKVLDTRPGRRTCQRCADLERARAVARRGKTCRRCGIALADTTRRMCPICLGVVATQQREWRRRMKVRDLCTKCGKRPLDTEALCLECAENARLAGKLKRERIDACGDNREQLITVPESADHDHD